MDFAPLNVCNIILAMDYTRQSAKGKLKKKKYMQEHVRSSSEPPPGQQLGMPENQVPHSYPVYKMFGAAHAFP